MDDKIFLGKYRISAEEFKQAGELTANSLAYQGEEVDSGKKVVVELVPIGPLDTAALERIAAEAIAAKKLDHVNIPRLYDFGVEDDHLVYVTEDFEGTLAEEWVNTHGPMEVGPVLRIASQVVSALSAAAFQQIVHPAINPGNLALVPGQTAEGEWPLVKVLHFVGAPPKVPGTDIAVAAFDKSLHYVSPEQIREGTVDFRSEIYSLGCTMWFLLTGAPPLAGKKGPMALAPTTAAGKAGNVPKKVRRLLAQMLSTNPDARLRDPIEFYRKLQGCLVQVERREGMSRRFGVPIFFRPPAADARAFRRTPMKSLTLAALFLATAALAALVVHGYIRHRRVVRAEEPIGVRIGVSDAVAIATPAAASAASPMASNPTPETGALAQSNSPPSETAEKAQATNTNTLSSATNSLESVDKNQIANATPDLSPNSQEQAPAPVFANNMDAPPATGPSETASARVANVQPPAHSTETVTQETAPRTIVMHEVRRAETAEPDVRRAELAPPGEGLDSSASETTVPSKSPTNAAAQVGENRDSETKSAEKTRRTDSESKVKPRPRSQQPTKQKPRLDERIYTPDPTREFAGPPRPLPRRSVSGRLVGVTPEGWWVMELPSNEIVIVPPRRRER